MYTLRCTKPLLRRLAPVRPPPGEPPPETTATLGDWYANSLNIGRQRLVLCTSERSLLSVVIPARDLPGLPQRLVEAVALLLPRIGISSSVSGREVREMRWVRFDRTLSRSVLGSMNDFALSAEWLLRESRSDVSLDRLAWELNETPCRPLAYATPRERATALLLGATSPAIAVDDHA